MASGTIVPGTSQSFASEIEKRADYIKTVVFDSPRRLSGRRNRHGAPYSRA